MTKRARVKGKVECMKQEKGLMGDSKTLPLLNDLLKCLDDPH